MSESQAAGYLLFPLHLPRFAGAFYLYRTPGARPGEGNTGKQETTVDIEPQIVINGLFAMLGIALGYILNNVRQTVERLQAQDVLLADKVQHIEVLVAGQYVRRDDFDRVCNKIFDKLDVMRGETSAGITRVEEKLNGKQDR